ncbi:MAG: TonB-dependent receptor [Bacteroidetes bacterium]|nr:TonB-dependent receptor [Bacteroidota bacterium]
MSVYNNSNPQKFFFKHWTRKSYSIFNSLSKTIHIGVLLYTFSILCQPLVAQDSIQNKEITDEIKEEELDEVVISASKAPVLQSELMRVVQVITRKEIEHSPAQNIADILEYARGIDIRNRGGFGVQADVSIRGGTFDQTLLLLNGVNISDPQTGHHNLNLAIDISCIERIEILQGSGARIFGPNAFNGAINIITITPQGNFINADLSGGHYGYYSAALSSGFSIATTSHFLSVSGKASDGFVENTDFKNNNVYYRTKIPLLEGSVDLQAGYNEKAFGANSFYSPRFPNQFEETQTLFASMKWIPQGKINLKPIVYFRRHYDRFELFRSNAPAWYNNHNHHLSNVYGASLTYMHTAKIGITIIGLDYRFEDIYSNVLGYETNKPKQVKGYDALYSKYYSRQGISLMAEQNLYLGNYSISGGLLTYYNSSLEKLSFFPGLDLGYNINEKQRIFASISKTLRLPTFTDLFYTGPTNISNPDLAPEEAISLEAGIKNNHKFISIEISGYRRWGKNMIDWVKYEGDEKWQSMNHTKVDLSGFEVYFNKPLKLFSNREFTTMSLSYAFVYADKNSNQMVSNYVLDYLKHKLDISLTIPIFSSGGISYKTSYQHRSGSYMHYENGVSTNITEFEPFWLADIKAFYKIKQFKIYTEVSNLFNVEIIDIANVPQPGRWVKIGITYSYPTKL